MPKTPIQVLLVEDDPGDAHITQGLLTREARGALRVEHVQTLRDAIDRIATGPPNAVLLDLSLPDSRAPDTLQAIWDSGADLPIVVMTGNDDVEAAETAVRNGAQDYLLKGELGGRSLERCIRYAIERHQIRGDIKRLAFLDQLTGLPNRSLFQDRFLQLIEIGNRSRQKFALHLIDLDRFKQINDSQGHAIGDMVLTEAAARMANLARKSDTIARLGGDEFAVLQTNISQPGQAGTLARKIVDLFIEPLHIDGRDLKIGATVGVAIFDDHGTDPKDLMRNADLALYAAKDAGRNLYRLYDDSAKHALTPGRNYATRLKKAVCDQQFDFHFQPIIGLQHGKTVAFEALLRWLDPQDGVQEPSQFMPSLESSGLLASLNQLCVERACAALATARNAGHANSRMHINMSPSQLRAPGVVELIAKTMACHALGPGSLAIELMDSASMEDADEKLCNIFAALHAQGVGLAIDGFGLGGASLACLQRHAFEYVKIHGRFMSRLGDDPVSGEIVRSVLELTQRLGRTAICVDVETARQLEELRRLGADEIQGFHIAKPAPMETLLHRAPDDAHAYAHAYAPA